MKQHSKQHLAILSATTKHKERLEKRSVHRGNGCIECSYATNYIDGYPTIGIDGVKCLCHRLAFHIYKDEPLDDDLYVLHSCDNKVCINPEHLRLGTQQDNAKDRVSRDRTRFSDLTRDQVWRIFELDHTGYYPHYKIGLKFNLSAYQVRRILKGEIFPVIKEEYKEYRQYLAEARYKILKERNNREAA